ncbi:MAG TPA: hypothetical protein VFP80_10510 [Thermoanaerobaculia bacterium]|nr:hypothetical protein [Thermoanaerobaculia bacterium]
MYHDLTIGFFDPTRVFPHREVNVSRVLSDGELDAIDAAVRGAGFAQDVREFLDPRGVLVVPWLSGDADEDLAAVIGRAAHALGATVADVEHGAVINPDDPEEL